MFVSSMKLDEFIKEFEIDMTNVLRVCNAKQVHFDKKVRKGTMFPMRASSLITTTRKNRWVIWWEARSRQNVGDYSIVTFAAILHFFDGRYAIMRGFSHDTPVYFLYTPHFFSRFAQRCDIALEGEELIKRYFKANASYGFTTKKDIWYNAAVVNVYGSSCEGIALGVQLNLKINIIFFRTFITYDMMKGQQIDDFTLAEETRKELNEKELTIKL